MHLLALSMMAKFQVFSYGFFSKYFHNICVLLPSFMILQHLSFICFLKEWLRGFGFGFFLCLVGCGFSTVSLSCEGKILSDFLSSVFWASSLVWNHR